MCGERCSGWGRSAGHGPGRMGGWKRGEGSGPSLMAGLGREGVPRFGVGFGSGYGPTKAERKERLEEFKKHLEERLADVNEELGRRRSQSLDRKSELDSQLQR